MAETAPAMCRRSFAFLKFGGTARLGSRYVAPGPDFAKQITWPTFLNFLSRTLIRSQEKATVSQNDMFRHDTPDRLTSI